MKIAFLLCAGYLLGSIPFGLIIGKVICGIDIRKTGSGNIGATNVLRTLGPGPGGAVFILDVLKGFIPVFIAKDLFEGLPLLVIACGVAAVMGHTFSIFLKFRGGKGVATGLGVVFGLNPAIGAIGFGVWAVLVFLFRYVSLASILAVAAVASMCWVSGMNPIYSGFITLISALIIIKHRSNIIRLLQGKEARWGEKANKSEG
ncbi:MAG: glycerol-3-phosphate 1-O-acyltransferase PlsY [Armatimonadota bacterium]|jgi:glycerol-3-phosphate acyltransferase PlsY